MSAIIFTHRSVQGRGGGTIAVPYKTHWKGHLRPSWERESDFLHARQPILEYWAGAPLQLRQANRVYRHMRVGAAQRELARGKGARFLPPGYSYANHQTWARRFLRTILPVGDYFSGTRLMVALTPQRYAILLRGDIHGSNQDKI